ncbi:MAG: hypothetical protein HY917_04000, partial [Candidatus Diapherotrites archaeon]|nr:hypothetical protein [Candidatus Diapherotrites archaeon]
LKNVSSLNAGEWVSGGNLVMADVDFSGTYLPSMGEMDSLAAQLMGKTGAFIGSNGNANPLLLKSLVCSLALNEEKFGPNDYYRFSSLGDRYRNARNNLRKFGPGGSASITADYSLLGAPFLEVKRPENIDPKRVQALCGKMAEYNVYPFETRVRSETPSGGLSRMMAFDFSDYNVVSGNGFEWVELKNALLENESGVMVPVAFSEASFPLGTLISSAEVVSKTNPVTLNLNVPFRDENGLRERVCDSNYSAAGAEVSSYYSEDRETLYVKVNPLEVNDCVNGSFTLYRNMEFKVDYSLTSPVLLSRVGMASSVLPSAWVDVNAGAENLTPAGADGILRVTDGNFVLAEQAVSVGGNSVGAYALSFQAPAEEGFHDYSVEFVQGERAVTATPFRLEVSALEMRASFEGSYTQLHQLHGTPSESLWDARNQGGWGGGLDARDSKFGYSDLVGAGCRFPPSFPIDNFSGVWIDSKPFKRFSIHDLPVSFELFGEIIPDYGGPQPPLDVLGIYSFEGVNNSVIRWRRNEEPWTEVNVSDWNTDNLGFEAEFFSSAAASSPGPLFVGIGFWMRLMDGSQFNAPGSHGTEFISVYHPFESDCGPGSVSSRTSYIAVNSTDIQVSRPYAARGTSVVSADFENHGSVPIPVSLKQVTRNGSGTVLKEETVQLTLPPGSSGYDVNVLTTAVPETYSMDLEASYGFSSKTASVSFAGNNPPVISVPSKLFADAFDLIELDYSVSDPDSDPVEVSVSAPFDSNRFWQTTDADEGTREVVISASDGFESVSRTVQLEVGPPRVECQADLDCGTTITVNPRVCSGNRLYAEEVVPECNNPGTFQAFCSSREVQREYGSCFLEGAFADGNASGLVRFEEAGTQTFYLEVPRKARVTNAFIKLKGAPKETVCGNALAQADSARSTAYKHVFADGRTYWGLPLGPSMSVASRETVSDSLEGFPGFAFGSGTEGIAHSVSFYPVCMNVTPGYRYLEVNSPCDDGGGGTYTNNVASSCGGGGWVEAGYYQPTNNAQIHDYCIWNGGGQVSFNTNIGSVYNYLKGQFAGIGDNRPGFVAKIRQFQSGKELVSQRLPLNAERVFWDANADLWGQRIDYFVSANGVSWRPVEDGSFVEFPLEETGEFLEWKAVFSTTRPARTPRLFDANVCVETAGAPEGVSVEAGGQSVDSVNGLQSFEEEMALSSAMNAYLDSVPWDQNLVRVPVSLRSSSQGLLELQSVGYEWDLLNNT